MRWFEWVGRDKPLAACPVVAPPGVHEPRSRFEGLGSLQELAPLPCDKTVSRRREKSDFCRP